MPAYITMPCDLGRIAWVFRTKHDPDMILGHCKVNIVKTEQLTRSNNAQRHAKTVQLVFYNSVTPSQLHTSARIMKYYINIYLTASIRGQPG